MRALTAVLSMAGLVAAAPARAQEDVILQAMREELSRSVEKLQLPALERPYFIAYSVADEVLSGATASFGALQGSNQSRRRTLSVEVRVGDRNLDNTGFLSSPFSGGRSGFASLSLDDDPEAIRREIWLTTDAAYKSALEELSKKRAALQTRTRGDDSPDFSQEEPATVRDAAPPAPPSLPRAEALVKSLSALFREVPEVATSRAQMLARTASTRYVNSEGSSFYRSTARVCLGVSAAAQAPDGTPLEDFVASCGRTWADLPAEEELKKEVRELGHRIGQLRQAANLETTYNGPVLFEGQAAAELFAQAFAPKLLATRVPVVDDARFAGAVFENPFLDRLGGRVLPEFLDVTDDPTLDRYQGVNLAGGYSVDDDGVRARATRLVEKGLLKTLLSTRQPVRGIPKSSGNRRGGGPMPSNLVVATSAGRSAAEMKEALLKAVQDRGAKFGIVVRRLGNPVAALRPFGGAPRMDRDGTRLENATVAYKVFPDGREELVRVATLAGLGPESFREIVAASKEATVINTFFGVFNAAMARSSPDLVSFVVPSLLFEEVSLRKLSGEIPRPMVAPHPFFEK